MKLEAEVEILGGVVEIDAFTIRGGFVESGCDARHS